VQCLRHRPLRTDCSLRLGLKALVHLAARPLITKIVLLEIAGGGSRSHRHFWSPVRRRHFIPELNRVHYFGAR
jgi:hypothetical protein